MREEERENQAWINSHWEKEPGAEMSWDEAEYRHQNAYMLAWSLSAGWLHGLGQVVSQHSLVEFGIQVKQLQSGNGPAAL